MKKKVKISISSSLDEKIKKRVKNTGFKSVEEYIEYVLSEVISTPFQETKKEEVYSKEDEENVKKRLKALGYLG